MVPSSDVDYGRSPADSGSCTTVHNTTPVFQNFPLERPFALITSTEKAVFTTTTATRWKAGRQHGRKAASTSTRVDRKLVRGLGLTRRSARTARLRQVALAARGHSDQSHDREPDPEGKSATVI